MMGRVRQHLYLLVMLLLLATPVVAQEAVSLHITGVDKSEFPTVRLTLIAADAQGAPITDLSGLSVRENGIPVSFETAPEQVGVNVIFVVDANGDIDAVDGGDGVSRGEKVTAAIGRFAQRFMSPAGLDRVSVIVPDEPGADGRFLLQDATIPADVTEAIAAYRPEPVANTPLQAMMALALAHAAETQDGRFQAILLFTDGGQLNRQLTAAPLVARAQALPASIYVAILGARADANEIDNAARLYEPTGGRYVHMPTPAEADPVYLIWQGQRTQTQISYRSLQTSSGVYPLTANLGSARAATELELTIAAPELAIRLPEPEIRRVGAAFDTPLTELRPATVEVPVAVTWPDGMPRQLAAVSLQVDGQPVSTATDVTPTADGTVALTWPVQTLESGAYRLAAEATDVLGYTAASDPVTAAVTVSRPDPPTPTPVPTPLPETAVPAVTIDPNWLAAGLGVVAILVVLILTLRAWRRRRAARRLTEEESGRETAMPFSPDELLPPLVAFLETTGTDAPTRWPLEEDNIVIGRDPETAQVVLADPSVARLHARIRRRDDGFWLYDEGSATGTNLNFAPLGLSPQPLQDGDLLQFGRVRLLFRLRAVDEEE